MSQYKLWCTPLMAWELNHQSIYLPHWFGFLQIPQSTWQTWLHSVCREPACDCEPVSPPPWMSHQREVAVNKSLIKWLVISSYASQYSMKVWENITTEIINCVWCISWWLFSAPSLVNTFSIHSLKLPCWERVALQCCSFDRSTMYRCLD